MCYKYKPLIIGVFLSAYLLFNAVNILHYHSYDILVDGEYQLVESVASDHHTGSTGSSAFCIVHTFYSSILSLSLIEDASTVLNDNGENLKLFNTEIYYSPYLSASNQLRGPPYIS